MTLKIISSTQIAFQGEAQSVTLPGTKGRFTILNNHATLVSTLSPGKIVYTDAEGRADNEIEITGGIVDVDNNIVSVCIY